MPDLSVKTPFQFLLKSKEAFLNLEMYKKDRIYERVVISDSIYNFYPIMDTHINDKAGIIVDGVVSAEGKVFLTKIGSDQKGYEGWLESEWVWLHSNTTDVPVTSYLGGITGISYSHRFYRNDIPRVRAWDDTISNIVTSIIERDYNLKNVEKIFITRTNGKKIRQQPGVQNNTFLKALANRAYSKNFEYSPFITFLNSAGEFYFCAIDDLLKRGTRISDEPYLVESNVDSETKRNVLSKIESIKTNGLVKNKQNYKVELISYRKEDFNTDVTNLVNHILNERKKDTILINKDLKKEESYFSFNRYNSGLYNAKRDFEDYKGYKNSIIKPSLFNLRMNIIIPFNYKAITGRIIPLKIGSVLRHKAHNNIEYSGDWLILESRIFYDVDGIPYTYLEIGKNSVRIDDKHVLKPNME